MDARNSVLIKLAEPNICKFWHLNVENLHLQNQHDINFLYLHLHLADMFKDIFWKLLRYISIFAAILHLCLQL